MNRLKTKGKSCTSRFFKDSPSQDEKAANASAGCEADFDAGIERSLRQKPSRLFRAKNEKPLPAPPSRVLPFAEALPAIPKADNGAYEETAGNYARDSASVETNKPLPFPPVAQDVPNLGMPTISNEKVRGVARKSKPAGRELKSRPSFASLRSTSSRIFRANTGSHGPPPPPMPQLPIDTPTPKLHRPTLRPFESMRSARSSRSSSGRVVSISRPILSTQITTTPTTPIPSTVPFTKPPGPPPQRPPRPDSLDDETIALMRDGSARMILHTPNRVRSTTTTTTTTTSSDQNSISTRACSEEAYTRLGLPSGLPSGHSSISPPSTPISDSSLAANFPLDPSRPLPFRDSSGSVKGYGRFSAYIKARQQYKSGGYDDGVDQEDREMGPIEQYRESKCGDWTLEARVSGRLGEKGMVFKDRWGCWRFVADI
ncbi:hypothetical protein M3J07_008496 [Ascochyta lentis]